jgi:oxygen-independent coproporphyrinogen-3 oxidase
MHAEIEEQRDFLHDRSISTAYFGGGTPSLLPAAELQSLVEHAARVVDCSAVGEITVEANPDDVTKEWVGALRQTSVNRVSLGVQSFNDAELRFMNRRHTAVEAEAAVKRLQDAGLENITIDLIFGVEGFGEEVLHENIERALRLGVKHISAYHLTIEPDTAFGRRVQRGEMHEVGEEQSEREFLLLHDSLTAAGYEHYEVSNYALPGYRAQHNSSYWHGAEYLGIGAGAHSYNGVERHYVEQDVEEYIRAREYVVERLSQRDMLNEYVMTALRCAEGLDLAYIEGRFGSGATANIVPVLQRWQASGDVVFEGSRAYIPAERFLISDAVIESLFEV